MSMPEQVERQVERKAGRPRSAESHRAIIKAALELMAEEGFEAMSIEAIAARAGVGKTTIYRRWDSKADLVIDAIGSLQAEIPVINSGNLRNDLLTMFGTAVQQESPSFFENMVFNMIGVLKTNPEIFQAFYSRIIVPRLNQFTAMIEQAKSRGELRPDIDPLIMVDLLAGPLFFRMLFTSLISTLPKDWAEQIIDAVLNGVSGTSKTV